MSFRLKIGLSFCCILLLTIAVAVTSWWGMETALKRQNTIFSFNREVDRLFHFIATGEHSFSATHASSDAQAVEESIAELYQTLASARYQAGNQQRLQRNALGELKKYQQNFSHFTEQITSIKNLQGSLIEKSERLLSSTSTLTGQSRDSSTLLLQASLILNRFQEEQQTLQQLIKHLHDSQQALTAKLRHLTDSRLAASQKQVNRLKLVTILVSLFAVALSLFITLILSDLVTRPLERLKQSAQEILKGNLDTTVSLQTRDEIGQLGDIFNQMTAKLRRNFEDIKSYRHHLEELVEERTLDLKKEMDERSNAEQALRSSEERLRTIVDQSPMGIILWDTQFQVSQWNQAAEKILGYSTEEAVGLPAKSLIPEEMHPHIEKIWQKLITTQDGIRSHNENITKSGSIIQCDWFNSPIFDALGNLQGALSLVENVTERKRTEKELRKIEKLESTGILAGGIAHDFNNILTAILGNINLSLFDDSLSAKTRELLIAAEKASIQAKDLTQQLLTFAKGGEPIRESTSLAEIIKDSATFVLHGGNVSCSCQLPDDLWYAVVDRGQFSQVIQNIVLNARHSMPKGGKVSIACENVLPANDPFTLLEPEALYVRISIKDSGIGIHAELLDKIFDPYFSTKQEGSGLGLAITHSIVNKHRGHILVNSQLGKGTEFVIYLPATSQATHKGNARQVAAATTRPMKVLVMDDEAAVQKVLGAMLTTLGHSVLFASEGREAIRLYLDLLPTAEPVDLVIADLTIPGGLGGKETMLELQKIDPGVRGIVSSGYSTDPVMASFKEHGFRAAVTKPYLLQGLAEAIETACQP